MIVPYNPGSGSTLSQNPGSGSKFNVFWSTTLLKNNIHETYKNIFKNFLNQCDRYHPGTNIHALSLFILFLIVFCRYKLQVLVRSGSESSFKFGSRGNQFPNTQGVQEFKKQLVPKIFFRKRSVWISESLPTGGKSVTLASNNKTTTNRTKTGKNPYPYTTQCDGSGIWKKFVPDPDQIW